MLIINQENLQAYASEFGATTTYESLAEHFGCSVKTLQNHKASLLEAGLILKRKARVRKAKTEDKALLVKSAINSLHRLRGLPVPFESFKGEVLYQRVGDAKEVLQSKFKTSLSTDDRFITDLVLSVEDFRFTVNVPTSYPVLVKEVSEELLQYRGYSLTKAQVSVISTMLAYIRCKRKSPVTIQASAGTSKTTCINIFVEVAERLGYDVLCLARTNTAKNGLKRGKTIAKYMNEKYAVNTVDYQGSKLDMVKLLNKYKAKTKSNTILVVDEFSLVSPSDIATLIDDFKHVIFVGDINQLGGLPYYPAPVIATLTEQFRFLGLSHKCMIHKEIVLGKL